ncbi:MAG: hypothetical protein IKZ43_10295 [Acidaminococcaceae bacterium]|nr:hypothetical protein [Acidaminococcaceae bacterium]
MDNAIKARIAYNGPALSNGEMDVRSLAPALIAFADLVDNVNRVIGGENRIRVLLNEDSIQKGSFDITFLLETGLMQQAKLFVGLVEQTGLAALMEVLGWGVTGATVVGGIFTLIKHVRSRKLSGIQRIENNKSEISLEDGEKIITTENTLKVFLDVNCRVSIEKIIEPVTKEGIDSFELRDPDNVKDKQPLEIVTKKETEDFVAPPAASAVDEEPIQSEEQELLVKISLISFEQGKWKLTDGNNTFWARIDDETFCKQVEKGELSFANGDMLRVRYYIKQSIKSGNLYSEYIVTKVLELKKRPEQIQLDFSYNE